MTGQVFTTYHACKDNAIVIDRTDTIRRNDSLPPMMDGAAASPQVPKQISVLELRHSCRSSYFLRST